jgi:5'-3' exonuclease
MGVVVWPMIELEADDALASAAHIASEDEEVQKVAIWTPDKDLAQCVRDTRVVQIDGRHKTIRDAAGIREKFGVDPLLAPRPNFKTLTSTLSISFDSHRLDCFGKYR